MKNIRNWAIILVSLCIMFLIPLAVVFTNEIAMGILELEPSKALLLKTIAVVLILLSNGVWALALLFVADHIAALRKWGLMSSKPGRRSLNISIMTVLGYLIVITILSLYGWAI